MSVVDTLVLGTLAIGLVLGLLRGFVPQLTGIVGIVAGLFLAGQYHESLRTSLLDPSFQTDHNGEIAFISILVATVLFAWLIGWLLQRLIEKLQLGAYDHILGAGFGVVKAGLIVAAILLGIVYFAPDGGGIERSIGSSRTGPVIWRALDRAARLLPERARADVEAFLRENSLPSETAAAPE